MRDRVRMLIEIAHPRFRAALHEEAGALGYISSASADAGAGLFLRSGERPREYGPVGPLRGPWPALVFGRPVLSLPSDPCSGRSG